MTTSCHISYLFHLWNPAFCFYTRYLFHRPYILKIGLLSLDFTCHYSYCFLACSKNTFISVSYTHLNLSSEINSYLKILAPLQFTLETCGGTGETDYANIFMTVSYTHLDAMLQVWTSAQRRCNSVSSKQKIATLASASVISRLPW